MTAHPLTATNVVFIIILLAVILTVCLFAMVGVDRLWDEHKARRLVKEAERLTEEATRE